MSRVAPWCAVAGVTLGFLTLATWNTGSDTGDAAAPVRTAQPPDGAQLFQVKGCSRCHLGPDTQPMGDGFPPLDDAANWAGARRAGMTAEEYLSESMRVPAAFISPAFSGRVGGTSAMPTLMLTPEEIDALIAYLLGR